MLQFLYVRVIEKVVPNPEILMIRILESQGEIVGPHFVPTFLPVVVAVGERLFNVLYQVEAFKAAAISIYCEIVFCYLGAVNTHGVTSIEEEVLDSGQLRPPLKYKFFSVQRFYLQAPACYVACHLPS